MLAVGIRTAILTFIIINVVDLQVSDDVKVEGLEIMVHSEGAYASGRPVPQP